MRKFHGLKAAVGALPKYNSNDGLYVQVNYDLNEDKVYTSDHIDFGFWSHTRYVDPDIIFVGNYTDKVTMNELKAHILDAIERREMIQEKVEA